MGNLLRSCTLERSRHRFINDINCFGIIWEQSSLIISFLQVIQDLAENVRDEGNASKKLCNECIREYTEIAIFLLPIYIHERTICEAAFAYFKTILDVLKSQMGAESVEVRDAPSPAATAEEPVSVNLGQIGSDQRACFS